MKEIYRTRICGKCGKTNILINDEVEDTIKKGKYISCSHCGSQRVVNENETSDLRKCMEHSSYKKVRGAIRQVRQE
ncbi:hypothetical protein [Clostridium chromiireducens]|uniref:Uncharacterized protein n=1 Tax=Clostridium chromiireducens TaxID=225345 RepID=A0A1V4IUX4_9CLOT|nr:hypothetical protein [Clostridium chromiireducens]OPJ63703.1 hypothetical protein CLCHR_15180 [Clostridium chromiireducens]